MEFHVTLAPESLSKVQNLRELGRTFIQALRDGVRRASIHTQGHIVKELSGPVLKARTGTARRSIEAIIKDVTGGAEGTVGAVKGPATAYLPILEHGGTIHPIQAKWLTIPKGPALTPAGVARYPSARDVPVKLRFVKSRSDPNTAVLIEDNKMFKGRQSKGSGRVWFVLKKSVTIPAFQWLSGSRRAVEDAVRGFISKAVQEHLLKHGK